MDENQRIKQSIKELSFLQRLMHIWHYYKWFIIIGAIAVIFTLVCITQCATRKSPDAVLMYAGPQPISSHYFTYIDNAFSEIMSQDYNGDGYKETDFLELTLATTQAKDDLEIAKQALQNQATNKERFYIERTTGPSIIYLIDKKIYPSMQEHLLPLSEALGYTPENALDEYGIALVDLPCYLGTDLKYLPDEAVICVRRIRQGTIKDDNQEYYDNNIAFFKDIVEWRSQDDK